MFTINTISNKDASDEVKNIYDKMTNILGFLPPHTQLFATLDLHGLKEFIDLNMYLHNHKVIDSKLLPFIRLYISTNECRGYCKKYNTKLLMALGIKKDFLRNITEHFQDIPFAKNQKLLALKVIKAIYESNSFTKDDLEELYKEGFTDKDFYDVLNYATIFMAKSKIIDIYLKK